MALPTASDNVFPKVIISEAAAPSSPSAGQFKLFVDSADHLLKYKNSAGTVTTLGAGMTNPMTTSGDIIYGASSGTPTRLAKGSDGQVLTLASGLPSWAAGGGGGGSISTVDGDLSADVSLAQDSTFHDITSLTGFSLAAGTWVGFFDILFGGSATAVTVVKVTDGTTDYAAAELYYVYPGAVVAANLHFFMKPTVLGSTTTMKLQYWEQSDGGTQKIYKVSTRAGTTPVSTHVTFMKIA